MASFVKYSQAQVVFFSEKPVYKELGEPNLLCLKDG